MRIDASAGRPRKGRPGVMCHCERLSFRSDDGEDAVALSALYRAIVHGDWGRFANCVPSEGRLAMQEAWEKTPTERT